MFSTGRGWAAAAALGFGLACGSVFASVGQAVADPGIPAEPGVAQPVTDQKADASAVAVPVAPSAPPNGVSHLPSPDSLPPGTTQAAPQQQSLGYLRDLFHAVRSDDVTMKDALLLLAQHPMDVPETSSSAHRPSEPAAPATVEPAPAPQPTPPGSP